MERRNEFANIADELGAGAYLVKQNEEKDKRIAAMERRIKHLEFLLEQRNEETQVNFRDEAAKIGRCEDDVKKFFINHPGEGFSYTDARHLFTQEFHYEQKNIDRRMRQLATEGFLWKSDRETGEVKYYLKLNEQKGVIQ